MLLVNTTTRETVTDGDFYRLFADTSFPYPLTNEVAAPFGYALLEDGAHPTLGPNQYEVMVGVAEIGGQWLTIYEARDYTPEQIEEQLQKQRERMVVTPFQAKAALFNAGLLDDVEAAVLAAETPTLVKLAWVNAVEFRRMSPMIVELASTLNLTDDQLDALFEAAANIVV